MKKPKRYSRRVRRRTCHRISREGIWRLESNRQMLRILNSYSHSLWDVNWFK